MRICMGTSIVYTVEKEKYLLLIVVKSLDTRSDLLTDF